MNVLKIDAWYRLRQTRDKYLTDSDKTQLADFPISTSDRALWKQYRQYLRDCPKLYNDETVKQAKVKTFIEWTDWKRDGRN